MQLKEIVEAIVKDNELHCKWLNTLSFMENCGARKISQSEHPTLTPYIVLKHAAEEHRHAFYLKGQLRKLNANACPTYERQYMLAPIDSYHYLHAIDTQISRYLKEELNLSGYALRFAAYVLVTYAIEVRADEIYPIYQEILERENCPISVMSIILEEEGHLAEMEAQLEDLGPRQKELAAYVCRIEQELYDKWLEGLSKAIAIQV